MTPRSPLRARFGLGRVGTSSLGGRGRSGLLGAFLAVSLSGCVSLTQTNGPETTTMRGLFTSLTASSDCTQTAEGSQTHHTLTSNGDVASLKEAGGILGAALAFAGKFIPIPPGVRDDSQNQNAVPSPHGSPAVTGCAGEQTVQTPGPPHALVSPE